MVGGTARFAFAGVIASILAAATGQALPGESGAGDAVDAICSGVEIGFPGGPDPWWRTDIDPGHVVLTDYTPTGENRQTAEWEGILSVGGVCSLVGQILACVRGVPRMDWSGPDLSFLACKPGR